MSESLTESTVTVLFTEMVGPTELRSRIGDEAADRILRPLDKVVLDELVRNDGQQVKALGDGHMAYFGSARRAVACAIEIQQKLERHQQQDPNSRITLRIGVNSGEVRAGSDDIQGAAINAAARIAGRARGGEILISAVVKQLAGTIPNTELVDRGRFRLKGFEERWRLFEVGWRTAEADRYPIGQAQTDFVGRGRESARLQQHLDQVLSGIGSLVMVSGEPGVGKTRLCEELAGHAAARGVWVLRGRCYETEGAAPYMPFLEILNTAVDEAPSEAAVLAALGDSGPEVARVMPRLRRMFPDIPEPVDMPPEQERYYLLSSLRQFVARAAEPRPVVLLLDDLQWADDASLLLLQHLAERLREMKVLILGTYRDTDLAVSQPLARVLGDLLRGRQVQRLMLKRLPEQDVAAMLRSMARQDPPSALVRAINDEAEGNPFFVEEIFKYLSEEGRLFDSSGRFLATLHIPDLEIPSGVRLAIGRRLERLGPTARRVLTAAAVVGRSFDYRLLSALEDIDEDALIDAIDEAERIQLITTTDGRDGSDQLSFAHELIRQTLLAEVSNPRRRNLHLRIASAMEGLSPEARDDHAAEIAHHLLEAGDSADSETVVRYLLIAGDRAMASAAFEDALRHLERAAAYEPGDERVRASLFTKLGFAQRSLRGWEDALVTWDMALSSLEACGDNLAVGGLCSVLAQQLAWATRWADAVQIAGRGLRSLGDAISADRCRLLGLAGVAFSLGGNYDGGAEMLQQAHAMAQQLEDESALGFTLGLLAAQHYGFFQVKDSVEVGLRAAELLRNQGDLWDLTNCLGFVVGSARMHGDLGIASEMGTELDRLTTRLGNVSGVLTATRGRSPADLGDSFDLTTWRVLNEQDLHLFEVTGSPFAGGALTRLGVVQFWAGDWDGALDFFARSAAMEPIGVVGGYAPFKPLCLAYMQMRDDALAWLEAAEMPDPNRPNGHTAWTTLLAGIEVLVVSGEHARAAELYPLVKRAIDTSVVWRLYDGRLLETIAGMSAASGSNWESAEAHFERALDIAAKLPNLIEQAETRRFYASMLIRRGGPGDRRRGENLTAEAIRIYRRIQMPRHVELAKAALS